MMEKNELVVMDKVNALAGASLKKNIKGLYKALETEQKLSWTVASYVNEIFMEENYEEDFETDGELAKFLGISLAMVSQYKGAISFIVKHTEMEAFMTITRAYLLNVIDKEGKYEEFISWLAGKGIELSTLSDSKLKKAIKDWKEETEDTSEETSEEATEDTSEETEEKSIEYAIVTYRGTRYQIPVDVLAQYEVTE